MEYFEMFSKCFTPQIGDVVALLFRHSLINTLYETSRTWTLTLYIEIKKQNLTTRYKGGRLVGISTHRSGTKKGVNNLIRHYRSVTNFRAKFFALTDGRMLPTHNMCHCALYQKRRSRI